MTKNKPKEGKKLRKKHGLKNYLKGIIPMRVYGGSKKEKKNG